VFVASLVILILLMPLTNAVQEPAFDAPSQALLTYAKADQAPSSKIAFVGMLGLFGFLMFAVTLAVRFRDAGHGSSVPWILVIVAATVMVVMWMALVGLTIGGELRRRDIDATGASVYFGVDNGIFVASWYAVAGFLATAGAAALWSRGLPIWLGWSAVVIGAALFTASAFPLKPFWYFPYLLFYVWVAAASIALLRSAPRTA